MEIKKISSDELVQMRASLDEVMGRRPLIDLEGDLYEEIVTEQNRRKHEDYCHLRDMCDDLRNLITRIKTHLENSEDVDQWFEAVLQPLVDDTLPQLQKLP